RRGRLVDLVVDQQQPSGAERATIVLIERRDLDRAARQRVAHVVERPGRQGEYDRERLRAGQRRDRALIGRAHQVAGIDQADADAAVGRRRDGGVVELGLCGLDRGVIGGNRRLGLVDLGLLLIDVLLRLEALERKRLEALE